MRRTALLKPTLLTIPVLIFLFCLVNNTHSQGERWNVAWDNSEDFHADQLRTLESFNDHNYLILEFEAIPGSLSRSEMLDKGIDLMGYLGNNAFWVRMASSSISTANFREFHVKKLAIPDERLKSNPVTRKLYNYDRTIDFVIKLWHAGDMTLFTEWLSEHTDIRISSTMPDRNLLVVSLNNTSLDLLYGHPSVSYVGPHSKTGSHLLSNTTSMNRVNVLQNTSIFGEGLSGEGVNVGIWDGGLTGSHVDINDHVINVEGDFVSAFVNDHPTHVAGIISGKGHHESRTRGMAPKANIFMWDFNGDIVDEMEQGLPEYGLNIINSSFLLSTYNDPILETTCLFPGFYVLESSEIDKMVRDNPTLTHVIANGNQNDICQGAGYWSGIPIGLQSSKNVINVGWLDRNELFFGGSSVGPTFDGRLKPEVMSKGAGVRSTSFDHSYKVLNGSSMAAPATAGSITLLYEWFFDTYGSYPDAALIRAIVCNTAFDLFFTGPDYLFGFGRINALKALQTLQNTNYFVENINNIETKTFDITVGADVSQLNVAIAWSDKEAVPGALETLVNDIDLKVIGPGATQYMPWTLNTGIPFDPASTGTDSINNVEQVSITDPAPGTYTISVSGKEVPFGPQKVAITFDILQRGVTITNPVGGEQWIAGATEYIRWDAFGTGDNFTVDISYDDGGSWETIGGGTSMPLIPSTFDTWSVKDTTSHTCRMRITSGAYSSITGPFTIMRRANLSGFACDRHATGVWNHVRDTDDYIVYLLENDEYVPIDTIPDTSYVFTGLEIGSEYWFAVQVRDGTNLGPRSNGRMLVPHNFACNFTDDIGLYDLCRPLGFRYTFDGGLPYEESFQVVVKNYSSSGISGFNVCYQREGESMVCEAYAGTLTANAVDTFTFSAVDTFPDTLCYEYKIWTDFIMDTNNGNDTLEALIKVVPSYPFPIPYYTNFEEAVPNIFQSKQFAIEGIEEWDFFGSTEAGRLSIGQLEQLSNDGFNAITLDRNFLGTQQSSEAFLNLNLDGYQDSTIYLDFSFAEHREEYSAGDRIWARADDGEPWIEIYEFGIMRSNWRYTDLAAINLSRILIADNGQTYGRNFQLRFAQEGIDRTISMQNNDGRSFDNIHVYSAGEDVEIIDVDVQSVYCDSVEGSIPLTITVKNNSILTANNVVATFTSNTGLDHSEVIPVIAAGGSVDLTFSQLINYSPGDVISLDIFLAHEPDLYPLNDTVKDLTIVFQPYVTEEYYDDLETPSSYYAGGQNVTWERGTPGNVIISEAASGENAWVTNLTGRHNNSEESFLLTPCFDLTNYTGNPNIAFNLKLEIEDNFDILAFEYSEDGVTWKRLKTETETYNWFNGEGDYWDLNVAEWQTTSNNLSLDSLSDPGQVLFRFILDADVEYKEEGAGIDDIHVTEDVGATFKLAESGIATNMSLVVDPGFTNWTQGGEIVAGISSDTDVGTTLIGVKRESTILDIDGFTALARHFWLEEDLQYRLRLYLPYEEYAEFDSTFTDWSAPSRMTVVAYEGMNIDSSASNNKNNYRCIEDVQIKPYRDGYILEFDYDGPAEFYFADNSRCDSAEFVIAGNVVATALDPDDGLVEWSSTTEINIAGYLIEAGEDSMSYDSTGFVVATGNDTLAIDYQFTDSTTDKSCTMCYRVWAITLTGDSICIGEDTASFVFPSLVVVDSLATTIQPNDDVLVSWGTVMEKCNDRFELFVSTDGSTYNPLATIGSMGDSDTWTAYEFLDDVTPKVDTICYRLEQYLTDGSMTTIGITCVIFVPGDEDVVVSDFTATAINPNDGLIEWATLLEAGIEGFIIEAGQDSLSYDSIGYVIATGSDSTTTNYEFTDSLTEKSCIMCYRAWAITVTGDTLFAGEDTASFIAPSLVDVDSLAADIQPNDDVLVTWGTHIESCNDRFELLVSTDGMTFNLLATIPSAGESTTWTPYQFLDDTTPKMDTICYQLDQYFIDGSMVTIGVVCVGFEDDGENVVPGDFTAIALNPDDALIEWNTLSESGITGFLIEAGEDCMNYSTVGFVNATGSDSTSAMYSFTDSTTDKSCVMCYRAWAITISGDSLFVGEDTASFITPSMVDVDSLTANIQPNDDVLVSWGTHMESCNDRFELLVSTDGMTFNLLATIPSAGESTSWTPYQFLDDITPKMDTICYQLDQYFIDGSMVTIGVVCVGFEDDGENVVPGDFTATALNPDDALIEWNTLSESGITGFIVEAGEDCMNFSSIGFVNATGSDSTSAMYSFTDSTTDKSCIMCYRAWAVTVSGDSIPVGEDTTAFIFVSEVEVDSFDLEIQPLDDVLLTWGTHTEKCNDRFEVLLSVNSSPYSLVGTVSSSSDNDTWTPYSFIDDFSLKEDTMCYRLDYYLDDGTMVMGDVKCIIFPSDTTFFIREIIVTDALCFGTSTGAIDITINGGIPPYTIRWSNGAMTEDLQNIPAGQYVVIIEDSQGVIITSQIITVGQAEPLSVIDAQINNVPCNGDLTGSVIDIIVNGGTDPYNYQWSNGVTTAEITELLAGNYQLTVTDNNDCEVLSPIYIVEEPDAMSIIALELTSADCNGAATGSADIQITGGVPPYSYSWSDGTTTQDLVDVTGGTYALTVTDANDCELFTSVDIPEPEAITLSALSITDALCSGSNTGVINISVTGGSPPYSYSWSDGASTQDISAVPAGDYIVIITDNSNCTFTSETLTIGQPEAITVLNEIVTATCNGYNDGAIDLQVSGGSPPYIYSWNNGASTQDLTELTAADYICVITDMNGCVFNTGTLTISEPDVLILSSILVTDNLCNGDEQGSIDIEVDGGTEPYEFLWNNGSTNEDIDNLQGGQYTVTVTDANDCELHSDTITISGPDPVTPAEVLVSHISCAGEVDGAIDLTLQGGSPPYSILWDNGATTEDIEGLGPADYFYTVTDNNGCVFMPDPVTVNEPVGLENISIEVTDVVCRGKATGEIFIDVAGGTPPYSFAWSSGQMAEDISGLLAGEYSVTVFDMNNCEISSDIITITEPDTDLEALLETTPESALGATDGSINLSVSGGNGPYSFLWDGGQITEDLFGLSTGEYCVNIMDANDCILRVCAEVGLGIAIIDLLSLSNLTLYPNPAEERVYLHMVFSQSVDVEIEMVDAAGRYITSRSLKGVTDEETSFEVQDLAAGNYLIRLIVDRNMVTLPLVIQH